MKLKVSLELNKSEMLSRYLNKYNDTLLFLVLIPIINTINYHLTYSTIRWDWYTYTTYSIDTASGFIAWWIIRKVILWFDKKLPYLEAPAKRIGLQIVVTNVLAQGFIISQTEIVNALWGDGPLPVEFYTYNLFIFFIWILVINGIYIGIYFYDQWRNTIYLREKDRELRSAGFEVQLGNKVETISFDNIAAFYVENGLTYVKTNEFKKFVLDSSLNNIMPKLPKEFFFRLNRKYIVHRSTIRGYNRDVNGKLKATFTEGYDFPEFLIISRITSPGFKKWFSASSQEL